jgi:hypothetical protein
LGHLYHNLSEGQSARSRKLRPRVCLRGGCGRVYQPRRWNQRYCQLPECQKQLRRWQAAKRQQQRRRWPEGRKAHAAAERRRRARRRAECYASPKGESRRDRALGRGSGESASAALTSRERPLANRAADRRTESRRSAVPTRHDPSPEDGTSAHRGEAGSVAASIDTHPPKKDSDAEVRAWSRSKPMPSPFCKRPGCYQAVRSSSRCPAQYCSDECRQAMKRVQDRERKWLSRNTEAGRYKRSLEYEAARRARRTVASQAETPATSPRAARRQSVVNSGPVPRVRVFYRDRKEGPADDREENPDCRPRAPPSE